MLQLGHQPQRMGIVIEPTDVGCDGIQRFLAGMAKGRVAQVVRQRHGLGQVFVGLKCARQAARQLRHFQRMGQAGAVIIAFMLHKDLGLVLEAAEGGGMDDAVAVAAIAAAGGAFGFPVQPAPAGLGPGGIAGMGSGRADDGAQKVPCRPGSQLVCLGVGFGHGEDYIEPVPQTARVTMTAMPVTLSDRAAKRIADILKSEPQPTALRVAVTGGGCSGFQYNFALDDAQLDEDLVVEKGGAKVLIDPVSLDFLAGAEIDFTDDLIGQAFKVNNPNATASCGCGTSLTV